MNIQLAQILLEWFEPNEAQKNTIQSPKMKRLQIDFSMYSQMKPNTCCVRRLLLVFHFLWCGFDLSKPNCPFDLTSLQFDSSKDETLMLEKSECPLEFDLLRSRNDFLRSILAANKLRRTSDVQVINFVMDSFFSFLIRHWLVLSFLTLFRDEHKRQTSIEDYLMIIFIIIHDISITRGTNRLLHRTQLNDHQTSTDLISIIGVAFSVVFSSIDSDRLSSTSLCLHRWEGAMRSSVNEEGKFKRTTMTTTHQIEHYWFVLKNVDKNKRIARVWRFRNDVIIRCPLKIELVSPLRPSKVDNQRNENAFVRFRLTSLVQLSENFRLCYNIGTFCSNNKMKCRTP